MSTYLKEDAELLLIDIETAGLDPDKNGIVEIFAARVDKNTLEADLDNAFSMVAWSQCQWGKWPLRQHTDSGLLMEVMQSEESEQEMLTRFSTWLFNTFHNRRPHLIGNSVHFDRTFIVQRSKKILNWDAGRALHHRVIDVSGTALTMEVCGKTVPSPPSDLGTAHRAKSDALWSLSLLKAMKDNP